MLLTQYVIVEKIGDCLGQIRLTNDIVVQFLLDAGGGLFPKECKIGILRGSLRLVIEEADVLA